MCDSGGAENMVKPFVVACIPAYDEEKTIGGVVVRARKFVDKVLVCDDGSGDLTGEIAGGLGAFVLRHERNMGKGVAERTAFRIAKDLEPDVVVMLDGDGQHDLGEKGLSFCGGYGVVGAGS
jgi:glycosyltransferase involved in cell wall biosynthesis